MRPADVDTMMTLRFDMRAPEFGAPIDELYSSAIEMCAWAEDRGALPGGAVGTSRHRGSTPPVSAHPRRGHRRSRTERLPILSRPSCFPFTTRCASPRTSASSTSSAAAGWRTYSESDIDPRSTSTSESTCGGAARMADERLATLRRLLSAIRSMTDDRSITVTPSPSSVGGPQLVIGGGSTAAARRAGRFGLGLIAQAAAPGMQEAYEDACSGGRARAVVRAAARPRVPRPRCSSPTTSTRVGRTRSSPPPRRDDRGLVPSRRRDVASISTPAPSTSCVRAPPTKS